MTRLDVWLVEHGFFSSRQTAKRAIRAGMVLVNGRHAKSSTRVQTNDRIEILEPTADRPLGYWKLKLLDELIDDPLVIPDSHALDIGCSAGGFLLYLLEQGANVTGIEISSTFAKKLQKIGEMYSGLTLLITDAFLINPLTVADRHSFDLLLIDVTTEPAGTLKLISKYSCLLRPDGLLIAAFKTTLDTKSIETITTKIRLLGYNAKPIILSPYRKEIHIIGNRQQ